MDNNTTQIVFNRIQDFKNNDDFIDLKGMEFIDDDEIARTLSKFRDPRMETFRIIYMKDDCVQGYESITSNIPNYVVFSKKVESIEKTINRFKNQMERLNSNGYYIMHNHCSDSSKPSREDLKCTQIFKDKMEGFKGHMIISLNEYSFIKTNKFDDLEVENPISLTSINVENCLKKLRSNSIYNLKINSREKLIALSEKIKMDKDCSNIIFTNCKCEPRLVVQIPNHMINFQKEQLNGYIKNLARSVGGTRAFFSTTDFDTYLKSLEHLEFGTLKDSILFQRKNNKLCVEEMPDIISTRDLFEVSRLNIENLISLFERNENMNSNNLKENKSIYDYVPQELEEVPEGKIRILLKKVGKEPSIEIIDNTLEAKQRLVDGLIEVVPVYDVEDTLMICNEEGKLENLLPNINLDYDYIAGDCFFIGDDYKNGDFKSITREQIIQVLDNYKDRFFEYEKDDDYELDDEVR